MPDKRYTSLHASSVDVATLEYLWRIGETTSHAKQTCWDSLIHQHCIIAKECPSELFTDENTSSLSESLTHNIKHDCVGGCVESVLAYYKKKSTHTPYFINNNISTSHKTRIYKTSQILATICNVIFSYIDLTCFCKKWQVLGRAKPKINEYTWYYYVIILHLLLLIYYYHHCRLHIGIH